MDPAVGRQAHNKDQPQGPLVTSGQLESSRTLRAWKGEKPAGQVQPPV